MTISDERRGLRDRGKSKDRSTKKITGKVRMTENAELIETAKAKPQKTANLWIIWRSRMSGDRDLTE